MKLIRITLLFGFLFSGQYSQAEVATFAGGCFWCMEPPFEKLEGVKSVLSGYMGGSKENADYKKVSEGITKHLEVVQVDYDPKKVSYEKLVETFWRSCDPTQEDGQFYDIGDQYKTAIFFHSEEQRKLANASKEKLDKSGRFPKKIATVIREAMDFFPAEEYHQDYYKKNPIRYKFYRYRSGRDAVIEKYWGKKD